MFRRLSAMMAVLGLAVVVGFLSIPGPYRHGPWLTRTRFGLGSLLWWLALAAAVVSALLYLTRRRVK